MEVKEINSAAELNTFVATAQGGQFLQSWDWGEFQKQRGKRVWRFGIYVEDQLVSAIQIIEHKLPLSRSYVYAPHGPVFAREVSELQKEQIIKLYLSKARDITSSTTDSFEVFFRLEPRLKREEVGNFFFNLGLKKTIAIQPQDTQVIDLKKTAEELLLGMHHKTRYNIKLSERNQIVVREGNEEKDFEIFWQLLEQTTTRDDFRAHPKSYYQELWNLFSYTKISDMFQLTIKLFIAEYKGVPLAVGLFSFFGDRVVYLHGASSNAQRERMAPYALHWFVMQHAQLNGYYLYDLYGVLPTQRSLDSQAKESAWQGITRFKKGFGGKEINYVGTWDWVYAKMWYILYRQIKKFL
jgi:lipid II:glycine glycyltransferase (peptidoglycan interpeptide bridge formation enzyme)